jgi:hypothetical protein
LADVLIEACSASPARPAPSARGTDTAGKPEYAPEGCREWLDGRVENWPKGVLPPSGEDCLAAALEHFAGMALSGTRRRWIPPYDRHSAGAEASGTLLGHVMIGNASSIPYPQEQSVGRSGVSPERHGPLSCRRVGDFAAPPEVTV